MSDGVHRLMIVCITDSPAQPCRTRALDAASEARLVRAAQTGDDVARAELLEAFAPLIRSMSYRYRTTPAGHRELVRSGTVGLLRALERYDGEQGTPFWAYASWWVRLAMQSLG
jgi:DNA-directed RNA polymerase specialized sigma subunit